MAELVNYLTENPAIAGIIALAIYIIFPQVWPKVKHLFSNVDLPDIVSNNKSENSQRLGCWQNLFELCEDIDNSTLQNKLKELPPLLIVKKEETNGR